jgi:hypothetical protein
MRELRVDVVEALVIPRVKETGDRKRETGTGSRD